MTKLDSEIICMNAFEIFVEARLLKEMEGMKINFMHVTEIQKQPRAFLKTAPAYQQLLSV